MAKTIVIFGKKRHGKDFLATLIFGILKEYGVNITLEQVQALEEYTRFELTELDFYGNELCGLFSFAYPIKELVAKWAGKDVKDLDIPTVRENFLPSLGMSPRQAWQKVGQAMRDIDKDIWIKMLWKDLSDADYYLDVSIVCDGRFKNEYLKSKEKGFILVNIFNDDIENSDSDISENDLNDIYEDRYANFDYVIDNTGKDFEKVKEQVLAMLNDLNLSIIK